jgi:hypothetical protein
MYRHGDVLIAPVAAVPEGARRCPHTILAHGETTGHTHRVEPRDAVELFEGGDQLFLRVHAPARVVHEEHAPIALPPGTYRVWRQREYSPAEIRTIQD